MAVFKTRAQKESEKNHSNSSNNSHNPSQVTLSLKERLAQKKQERETRQKLIGFIIGCIFLAGIIGLPIGFLVEPKYGIVAALGIFSLIFAYQYPRKALWLFLIYMPFSGTVTYWIGGGNALYQIVKDFIYLPALLGLIQECRSKRLPILIPKQLLPAFILLLILSISTLIFVNGFQEFLPYCTDVTGDISVENETIQTLDAACKQGVPFLQGLLGLKVLVGYVPLIFCAYYLIEDKKQLFFLGRLLLILAIICCLLGLAQYWMLSSGRCIGTRLLQGADLFKPTLDAKCLVGGSLVYSPSQNMIRLPGTFVSPWHWGWFLISNSAITFTIAFFDRSFIWRLLGLGGMGLVLINAVISGQRIALGLVPIFIAIFAILTGQIVNFKRFIPIGIGLALILTFALANNTAVMQERLDSFESRWNAAPPHLFMVKQMLFAVDQQRGILGRGLGQATVSARVFGDVALVETFHAKVLYEIGYFGLLAFMFFLTYLTILTFKEYRLVKDPSLRSFASSFWVFILVISYFPYWYPLDTDPVGVYYWLFAGVIFKLPIIDKQEREKLLTDKNPESLDTKAPYWRRSRKDKLTPIN